MPQENGWATGPEYVAEPKCPYCGSEDFDSGSLDTQQGQVVETDCECQECGKTWDALYNVQGWYHTDEDGKHTLHEDTEQMDRLEYAENTMATLAKALQDIAALTTCEGTEAHDMAAQIHGICRIALEDGN